MDEEKLYKEYLKSVFYPINETYFYNVNLQTNTRPSCLR